MCSGDLTQGAMSEDYCEERAEPAEPEQAEDERRDGASARLEVVHVDGRRGERPLSGALNVVGPSLAIPPSLRARIAWIGVPAGRRPAHFSSSSAITLFVQS